MGKRRTGQLAQRLVKRMLRLRAEHLQKARREGQQMPGQQLIELAGFSVLRKLGRQQQQQTDMIRGLI